MIALIKNEWMKAWHGRKVWVFMLVMASFILLGLAGAFFIQANTEEALTSAEFAELGTGVLTTFVNLYAVILITGALAGEYATGTIKQLLIRPVSRSKVLFAKWMGNMLFGVVLFALVAAGTFTVGWAFFSTEQPIVETLSALGEMTLYMLPTLIFYMSLATLIAVLTKSTALTILITFLPYFFASVLQMLIMQYEWAKWVVFTHVDVYSNYHLEGIMEPPFENVWLSLGFISLHVAAFLIVAHIVFKKRDVL
ncbi:ABC transporter permease [Shouchella shacheensis]|uniref:ABC transporter permease n=1 Tax=Shouchella shacheensis TaxID=1649580 RepID=UPI00074052C3|nr:ABC transporter permease subunit [Shouchella shacheensis]